MIRLYGHYRGESSFAQVTRGMRSAAQAAGLLAGEFAVDAPDDERVASGADAAVALHCGAPLSALLSHRQGLHKRHWLLLAPNSEGLPPRLVQQLHEEVPSFVPGSSEHELRAQLQDHERAVLAAWGDWKCLLPVQRPLLDGLLAPSAWARAVLQSSFPQHRIICAPHGVNPEVHRPSPGTHEQNCKDFEAGQFRVLHFTSTLGQRKGTRELLLAWRRWARAEGGHRAAKMLVFANPLAVNELMRQVHELGIADSVGVSAVTSASGHDMAATIRYAHLICQPSRGEGFGLVPLEARACGVPVLATACTGHSEHMSPGTPGVIAVSHGDLESIDDYPGALAPSVSPSDIWAALETAHARWGSFAEEAQAAADEVRREWSWENKNKQVLAELVDEAG